MRADPLPGDACPTLTGRVDRTLARALHEEGFAWPATADERFHATLLERARHHRIAGLLVHRLRPTPAWNALPAGTRAALEGDLRRSVAVDLIRATDLRDLHHALRGAGLPVLLLKGAALAHTHYPAPQLRLGMDVDLLVPVATVSRVRRLLEDLGFELRGHAWKSHQFTCVRPREGGEVVVYDLHWRCNNAPRYARRLEFAEMHRQARPLPALGGIPAPAPPHALLLACMHLAGDPVHDRERLIWLYDIHLLTAAMDAEEARSCARLALARGLAGECLAGIEAAAERWPLHLDPVALETLRAGATRGKGASGGAHGPLGLLLDDLRRLPGWGPRLGLLREMLCPPPRELMRRYGESRPALLPWLYLRYAGQGLARWVGRGG